MPDDLGIKQPQDPKRVNVHQPHEVRYWCQKWGITPQQLRDAVEAVGDSARAVEDYLRHNRIIA